ncbi:MAG: hypothetical protein ACXAC2_11550, partial [Candidatus Kariarchaeaceae archaeon]
TFTGDSGSWTNADNITISIDGLDKGVYNYTIVVIDASNNQATNTIFITVLDTTNPIIIAGQNNITYSEGTVSYNAYVNSTDKHPGSYSVFRNGSFTGDSGPWTNTANITVDVGGLSKGEYNFTIIIYDESGNMNFTTFWVNVIDTTTPSFVDSSGDTSYGEDSSGNEIWWEFFDNYPGNYTVYFEDNPIGIHTEVSWFNGTQIIVNVDGSLIGTYNYTIVVYDDSGNFINDTIWVTVNDVTAPVFATTPDQTISEGSSGNEIQWNATDNYPGFYEVYRNDSFTGDTGPWTNADNVTISIDGLDKGVYNFTFVAVDAYNNNASNTVFITVLDTTNPIFISETNNITYSEGTTSYIWLVNSTDKYPDSYIVFRDSVPTGDAGLWTNTTEISIDIGGLLKAEYNFTIVIYDASGNMNFTTIWVDVIDTTPPLIVDSSGDVTYGEGFSGNEIWWELSDNYPGNYTIYLDESAIGGHTEVTWINGSIITIDVDGKFVGSYNYTIIVYDDSGNFVNDTIWVTVVSEGSAPELIEKPDDFSFAEGTFGNTLNWTATDDYPLVYILYRDGGNVGSSSWTNGTRVSINIDGLGPGLYNFTIEFQDLSRNYIRDSVNVTVFDNTSPIFTITPSIQEITIGSDETLSWIANDNYPDTYEIYQNDELVDSNPWVNFLPIEWDLQDLVIGDYNITIVFYDTSSNPVKHTTMLSVVIIQTSQPTLAPGMIVYEGYKETLNGIWVDENSNAIPSAMVNGSLYYQSISSSSIQEFTSPITTSSFSIIFDYTALDPGEYIWVLTFNHPNYETQEINFTITVRAHTLDVEFILPNDDIVPGEEYIIGVEVTFNDPELSALQLDAFGSKTGFAEGIPLSVVLDLELTDQASSIQNFELTTNANGYTEIVLTSDITTNLLGINSISAEILGQGTIQGLNYILPSNELPQVEVPTTQGTTSNGEDPASAFDPMLIAIIGGSALFLGFTVLLLKRRKPADEEKETMVPLSKDDIFIRLSEINSLRSVLIVNYKTGEPMLNHTFKEDEAVNTAIEQIIASYGSSDTNEEFVINTADRSLNELIFFDFLQVYRTLGDSVDIIMITHGKVSQMEKSLDQISAWLHKAYDLKEESARKSLFDQINDEIILNMHIRFGT